LAARETGEFEKKGRRYGGASNRNRNTGTYLGGTYLAGTSLAEKGSDSGKANRNRKPGTSEQKGRQFCCRPSSF
jgi:hypothetical protein